MCIFLPFCIQTRWNLIKGSTWTGGVISGVTSDGSDGASRNYFTRRRRRGAEVWLSGEHQTSALSSAVTNSHLKMSERTNRDSQIGGGGVRISPSTIRLRSVLKAKSKKSKRTKQRFGQINPQHGIVSALAVPLTPTELMFHFWNRTRAFGVDLRCPEAAALTVELALPRCGADSFNCWSNTSQFNPNIDQCRTK